MSELMSNWVDGEVVDDDEDVPDDDDDDEATTCETIGGLRWDETDDDVVLDVGTCDTLVAFATPITFCIPLKLILFRSFSLSL